MANQLQIQGDRSSIIIIGCPRSGFSFIAKALHQSGLMINHEQWGEAGIVGWQMTCKDLPEDATVLHQIRHPLDVIGSMQGVSIDSWRLLVKHTRAKKEHGILERCMRAYLGWNKLAESKAQYSYRIEDIDMEWPKICELAGLNGKPLPNIDRTRNHRWSYDKPTWADLQSIDLPLALEIAEYYQTLERA